MSRVFAKTPGTDKIVVADSPSIRSLQTYTAMAWIKLTTYGGSDEGTVFGKVGAGGVAPFNMYMWTENLFTPATLATLGEDTGFTDFPFAEGVGNELSLGNWIHVATSLDNTSFSSPPKIYVNGAEISYQFALAGAPPPITDSGVPFTIGNFNDSPANAFTLDGKLCQVRVYNNALTAAQINAVKYLTTPGSASGLVCYLPLLDNNGATEPDLSGNGNNGAITGTVYSTDNPSFTPVTVSASFVDLANNPIVGTIQAYLVIPSGTGNAFVAGTGMLVPKFKQSTPSTTPSLTLFGNDVITDQPVGTTILDTYYTIMILNTANQVIWKASYSFTGAGPFSLPSYAPLDTLN